MEPKPKTAFKTCPLCRTRWDSLGELLEDPTVEFLGFQPGPVSSGSGLLLFNHRRCVTTMALPLANFQALGQAPMFRVAACAAGLKNDLCLRDTQSPDCPPECICQYVWGIICIILNWPKRPRPRREAGA